MVRVSSLRQERGRRRWYKSIKEAEETTRPSDKLDIGVEGER